MSRHETKLIVVRDSDTDSVKDDIGLRERDLFTIGCVVIFTPRTISSSAGVEWLNKVAAPLLMRPWASETSTVCR